MPDNIELLAPAGTLECGMAAFNYGADAVYLGMKLFSARADAGNFSLEKLQTLIGVAHPAGRKVYVAVNTLVREDELPDLIRLLCDLRDLGVDALIVQDAALRSLIRAYFPEFELHASTQMSIHNVEGVREAQRLGYTRVVAARELSLRELGELSGVPGMEIEAFVHGALCYSYSGLCLLSACLNGASGNRGDCTYVCRNKFKIKTPKDKELATCCPFSMKDLALGDLVPAMRKAGVASLKIEGRKKTPLYVAAVTNYYRKLIDGTFKNDEELQAALDVKTIFSRPWTNFYTENVRHAGITDTAMLGPRGIEVGQVGRVKDDFLRFVVKNRPIEKHDGLQVEVQGQSRPYGFGVDEIRAFTQAGNDRWDRVFSAAPGTTIEVPLPDGYPDLPVGSKICCTSSQAVHRRYSWPEARPALCKSRNAVDFDLSIAAQKLCVSSHAAHGIETRTELVLDAPLSAARDATIVSTQAQDAFARLGDTGLCLGNINIENKDGLFVPKSMLNELRRRAAEDIQSAMDNAGTQYAERVIAETTAKPAAVAASGKLRYSLKIDHAYFLNMLPAETLKKLDEIVFAIDRTRPEELGDVLNNLSEMLGGRDRIRIAVPVIIRAAVRHNYAPVIKKLLEDGWRKFEVGNLGGFDVLKQNKAVRGLSITADWSLYALNHLAAKEWFDAGAERVTFCPEDTPNNQDTLAELLGNRVTAVVFQEPVLARSAVCAMTSIKSFCPGIQECSFTELDLTSNKGSHLVAVNDRCTTILLGDVMNAIGDIPHFASRGVTHFRLDFLWRNYSPAFVAETVAQLEL